MVWVGVVGVVEYLVFRDGQYGDADVDVELGVLLGEDFSGDFLTFFESDDVGDGDCAKGKNHNSDEK